MTKIGIIGDAHIGCGANLGKVDPVTQLNTRLLDFGNTFEQIIDTFNSKGVDIVVLAGDNFDSRHPTSSHLNVYSKCITKATDLGMKVLINVGNHDQQRNISTTTVDVFGSLNLPAVKVYQEMGVYSVDEHTHIIVMPYRDRLMMNTETNPEAVEKIRNELMTLANNLKGTRIIVGHFMLDADSEGSDPDSFGLNELVLPLNMFDGFDATVMGHIHKHKVVKSNPNIIYAGSMDRVTFGEKGHKKVSIIFDTGKINDYEIVETKVRNLREINLDYTNDNQYKEEINKKIMEDVKSFNEEYSLQDAIIKMYIKIKEGDMYYVDNNIIKSGTMDLGAYFCSAINISSTVNRVLRNSSINEESDSKKAFRAYSDSLSFNAVDVKERFNKCAEEIMEQVDKK